MFTLSDLTRPVIGAPMAGGPSSIELVVSVSRAGGLGMLAGGYRTTEVLMDDVREVRAAGVERFGVNLFVPEADQGDLAAAAAYAERLLPLARDLGVEHLPEPRLDDDAWDAKVEALLADPVPLVSFTFGCPDEGVIDRFHAVGTAVAATVTTVTDARYAAGEGVDVLVVQGPDAGGHRSTFGVGAAPEEVPLAELVEGVAEATAAPLVASGGLSTPETVAAALALPGVEAVQIGTALLRTPEAGTSATQRAALDDPAFTETAVTRVFSGRPARGLRNAWVDEHDEGVPAAYPAVNQVAGPIRTAAAAAGDPRHTHLWAGTRWRECPRGSVADVIAALLP